MLTLLARILSAVAFPLLLGVFACYETYRESQFPKANELEIKIGVVNTIQPYEKYTVFYLRANDSDFIYMTTGETNPLINQEKLLPYSATDTFFVGFNPAKNNEIITLTKNTTPIISYQTYEDMMWREIKEGPLAAAIIFLFFTIILTLLVLILPGQEARARKRFNTQIQEIPGVIKTTHNKYQLVCQGFDVLVSFFCSYTVNYSPQANFNFVRVEIKLPNPQLEGKLKKRPYKMKTTQANGDIYVVFDIQVPFRFNKTTFLKKLNKKIVLINEASLG
jgi:hypothetical protein